MSRIDEETKSRRKERVWLEVRQHNGIRQSEIAKRLNFENRTVYNYLQELADEGKVIHEGVYWYSLPYQETRLRRFELLPEEAMTLYLATRLFVKQHDKRNEPAESALYRLAEVLISDAGVGHEIRQAARELARRPTNPQYGSVYRQIIRAYIYRRKVQIRYRPLRGKEFDATFSVYLIEPSAIGFSTYIIGHSKSAYVDDIRSYKLERVLTAKMTNEPYLVPTNFPGLDILRTAWSIISGEKTERIVLRFSPAVKARVLETQWHPSQDHQPDPEKPDYLRWWVDVADTTDMLPWIRSWGSDVEVLEPEELKREIKLHVHKLAQMYNLSSQQSGRDARLSRLWGKTTKDPKLFHPALYHMLDVAHVAQQLLSSRASSRWRQVLARALQANADSLLEWLPYLIALHDIGKLSVPFQILNPSQWERLKEEGFEFGRAQKGDVADLHHTIVGRLLLPDLTADWPPYLRTTFLDMISGHHGIYQVETPGHGQKLAYIQEPPEWAVMRQQAVQLLQSYLLQQWPDPLPEPVNLSAAIVALNGFCILCDWLGSDETYFQPQPLMTLAEYVLHSRRQAYQRVKDAGFFQSAASHAPTTFTELFTFAPRPLQTEIDRIPDAVLVAPTLTIIEAPTGEGKTEAALTLARRIAALRGTDEMYIALPTTATSNAMYSRIQEHLEKRLGLPPQLVRLVHGQSFLKEDDLPVDPLSNGDEEEIPSLEWFAPKKVALLAPFGVGTVDQAELSVLNVRHNALRLIGLAGKTIILDEVHAYDTYMTTIIKRMLSWLAALGSSVILLSATLPQAKQRELITAYAANADTTAVNLTTYPNIITLTTTSIYTPAEPIAVYQPDKTIQLGTLTFSDEQAKEKAEWLLAQVKDGGCVCWITNTVNRAQEIFKMLPENTDIDLTLLHGRFPLAQRQTIETDILAKYSKPGDGVKRPQRGIVIGTQVLEQSLDLDFDLMVTDLAPIDLILQRAGRLHRHQRNLADRHIHIVPRLFINKVRATADQHIYSDYILRMTERALQDKTSFTLPTDYRLLVDAVYTETAPDKQDQELYQAWDKLDEKIWDLENKAHERLADEPLANDPFYRSAKLQGFSEDEDGTAWTVAQTRWSERETLTLIPLIRDKESAVVAGDATQTAVSLTTKVPREHQLYLLRHSLRVSHPRLVAAIKAARAGQRLPLLESALLKNVYPLWLTPAANDTAVFVNHDFDQPVYLHPKLGLVFGEYQGE